MKIKPSYLLMPDPADGGAASGAGSSSAHGVFEGSDDPKDGAELEEPAAGAGTPAAAAAAPPATAVLSPEEIANLVGQTVRATMPQQQQAAPQLTPEEFDRTFNMARIKPDAFQKFRALMAQETPEAYAEGAKFFEDMIQAGVKQAMTMSGFTLADLKEELLNQIAPVAREIQTQQVEKLRGEFFTAHKDLEQWGPIVEAVTAKLQASGALKAVGADKAKAFKLVADESRKIVQGLPGGGQGAAAAAPGQQQQSRTSRMSTLTSGGQGGTRQGGGASTKKSPSHAVFD